MPSTQFSNITEDEIVLMLMHVSEVAKPISPQRAAALALELSHMSMTREEIKQGCKRYAMSLASQFREIQLSDFTNFTITSERELREAVKELERREAELAQKQKAFAHEVEREVERRLSELTINLKREVAAWMPDETVTAINALYRARDIVKKQREEAILAQVPKMVEELNRAYDTLKSKLTP